MMYTVSEHHYPGPKVHKSKKADLGPPMSPASKAVLKAQTKIAATLAKKEKKKKELKKVRKERKIARATAIANGEEVKNNYKKYEKKY